MSTQVDGIGCFSSMGPGECDTCGFAVDERIDSAGGAKCLDCYADGLMHGADFETIMERVEWFEATTERTASDTQRGLMGAAS